MGKNVPEKYGQTKPSHQQSWETLLTFKRHSIASFPGPSVLNSLRKACPGEAFRMKSGVPGIDIQGGKWGPGGWGERGE